MRHILADFLIAYKLLHDQLDISVENVDIALSQMPTWDEEVNLVVYKSRNNIVAKIFACRVNKSWKQLTAVG